MTGPQLLRNAGLEPDPWQHNLLTDRPERAAFCNPDQAEQLAQLLRNAAVRAKVGLILPTDGNGPTPDLGESR
jgi:hypothetical protein